MIRTRVGYAGGTTPDPTYDSMGDHTESFQVDFDPTVTTYAAMLAAFWDAHSPQREAYGRQYMAAAFHEGKDQERLVKESRDRIAASLRAEVLTEIVPLQRFYLAEGYHQKYSLRRYKELMSEFAAYDERAFIDSTVAARLNGYLGGGGTPDQLREELPSLGLPEPAEERLKRIIGGRGRW